MPGDFEERFASWLAEQGPEAVGRRLVRAGPKEILVSKVDTGFAARLHQSLAALGELLGRENVAARYRTVARETPGAARVATWHAAVRSLLEDAVADGLVDPSARREVEIGVESVAALLDTVFWTVPAVDADYRLGAGEVDAYTDAIAKMNEDSGLFTRFYGEFEGKAVVNHCPGIATARQLLSDAWAICAESEAIEAG